MRAAAGVAVVEQSLKRREVVARLVHARER
jgi:hypothetical protein